MRWRIAHSEMDFCTYVSRRKKFLGIPYWYRVRKNGRFLWWHSRTKAEQWVKSQDISPEIKYETWQKQEFYGVTNG